MSGIECLDPFGSLTLHCLDLENFVSFAVAAVGQDVFFALSLTGFCKDVHGGLRLVCLNSNIPFHAITASTNPYVTLRTAEHRTDLKPPQRPDLALPYATHYPRSVRAV